MSVYSLKQLRSINLLIEEITKAINEGLPKIYSKELVELIFSEFYIRISSVEKGLNVTRKTASNYLAQLAAAGFLEVETKGREKVYINKRLIEIVGEQVIGKGGIDFSLIPFVYLECCNTLTGCFLLSIQSKILAIEFAASNSLFFETCAYFILHPDI